MEERVILHESPFPIEDTMNEALQPRYVPFYGDDLVAVQQSDGTIFVVFARVCDALGMRTPAQARRIRAHAVLQNGLTLLSIQTEGGPQALQCLRLDLVPLWLSGVHASRVKEALRPKLERYQAEAAEVLWQAFKPQILIETEDSIGASDSTAIVHLQQIAEMGRAITQMAEQQMEVQRKQLALDGRIHAAARIIKHVQGQVETVVGDLATVHVRLGMLEGQLQPAGTITEAQAAEISNRVKALAEVLTSKDSSKNHYQGIFAELYRRFNVSSYKLVRQNQYLDVLQFLDAWRIAHGT